MKGQLSEGIKGQLSPMKEDQLSVVEGNEPLKGHFEAMAPPAGGHPGWAGVDLHRSYLTQSVLKVVLQKSTPPQIRQLIFYYY